MRIVRRKLGFRSRSGEEPRKEGGKVISKRWMDCLKDPAREGKKVEVESVKGGEDLWDADVEKEEGRFPEHLVIMVNGLGGSAEDWRFAAEQFVKKLPHEVIVHRSTCNCSKLTFDGVDLMGERLAEEVLSVVSHRRGVQKISFVAHSLGGLIARYAIGRLYEPAKESSFGSQNHLEEEKAQGARIAGLEPINFITVATPHLGSRGRRQLPILCGVPFLERKVIESAHLVVGKTGKHLFLTDDDDGNRPLLLQMANDCDDIKFISALRSFKRCVAYANANYDHMVGWRTSSIRRQHELPKNLMVKDKKYPHIVHVDKGPAVNSEEALSNGKAEAHDLEDEMITGLNQVSWERIDVSFDKSRQRYIAHSTIQVKSYWMNSDGADVVFHMIDTFLI